MDEFLSRTIIPQDVAIDAWLIGESLAAVSLSSLASAIGFLTLHWIWAELTGRAQIDWHYRVPEKFRPVLDMFQSYAMCLTGGFLLPGILWAYGLLAFQKVALAWILGLVPGFFIQTKIIRGISARFPDDP